MGNARPFLTKMGKMKIIPATMRENRRYLLLNTKDKSKIQKAMMRFIGELGWAKAGPQFIESGGQVLLSINARSLDECRAALNLANIKVVGVSGTINKLKEKFLEAKNN